MYVSGLTSRARCEADISPQFILFVVMTALDNTSRLQAWLLIYLWAHPTWKSKVLTEMEELLARYDASADDLSVIPEEAWNDSLPTLQACIYEIVRLLPEDVLLRQNIGGDINVDGFVVSAGSYVVYPIFEIHQNAALYSDPQKFDPGRFLVPGAQKGPDFVGFGAGTVRGCVKSSDH